MAVRRLPPPGVTVTSERRRRLRDEPGHEGGCRARMTLQRRPAGRCAFVMRGKRGQPFAATLTGSYCETSHNTHNVGSDEAKLGRAEENAAANACRRW